jgi:hypothetical protein
MAEKKTGLAVLGVVVVLFGAFVFWTYGTSSRHSPASAAGVGTPIPARTLAVRKSPATTAAARSTPRPTVANPVLGDVNADGVVDRADVEYLTRFLFSKGPAPVGPADINRDGKVNERDIFALMNQISEAEAAASRTPIRPKATPSAASAF